MIEYPYGPPRDAYLNIKEAAKEPWRGITAWIQGNPWLIIDNVNGEYVLENESGDKFNTSSFERWEPATEHSALVAASRLSNSPFEPGKAESSMVGNLVYSDNQWDVRLNKLDIALPVEQLVEQYEKIRWSKTADLYPGMDYRCPECGSRNVGLTNDDFTTEPQDEWGGVHAMQCHDCGYEGSDREFEDEEPDHDDMSQDFYPDWTGAHVADFEDEHVAPQYNEGGGGATFEYNLPPASIHMRTHAAMKNAGLQARLHLPPELAGQPSFTGAPYPETIDVPTTNGRDAMALMMLENPENYNVTVETPHDPEAVRRIFDDLGGRRQGKVADGDDDREIKWVVLPGGEVVMEDPNNPVSNHMMLLAQAKGPEFLQNLMASDPHVMGLQGMINNGKINVAGYVMSDLSPLDRTYDPSKSYAGHVRVQKAVDQVRNEASARGIPITEKYYSVPKVVPGEGAKSIDRNYYDPLMNTPYKGKVATDGNQEPTVDQQKALTCPRCGSHTLRAFSPNGSTATLVCLTCGNEFDRDVHINPEASVKQAVNPIDPGMSAQIIGLMQQIEEAYKNNDQPRAQQLHQQMMQLMNNPNQPMMPAAKIAAGLPVNGPSYPTDPASQAQIANLMREISAASASGDVMSLRVLRTQLERLLGGNPAIQQQPQMMQPQPYARVDNNHLASTPEEYNLDTMTFIADVYDSEDPYAGSPINLDDYQQDVPIDNDDSNIDYVHCPACDGPGVLLGQLGNRIHYRCRNCGMDFNEKVDPNHTGPERDDPYGDADYGAEDPGAMGNQQQFGSYDDAKEVNQNTLKAFKDSSGNLIEAGKLYTLHHPSYKVPDVIKILNLEDDRIEASIASGEDEFPIHITHDDAFSLDPYEKTASGWSVMARRNFTADEQRELIDENPDGRARNFDKLNLSGTHYQIKEEATDPDFLLGW